MKTVLLALLWAVPLVSSLALSRLRNLRHPRTPGLLVSLFCLAISSVFFVSTEASALAGVPGVRAFAVAGLVVDGLSAVLLPLTCALPIAVLLGAPRADNDVRTVARVLLVEACALGSLVSANLLMLAGFWLAWLAPLWADADESNDPVQRRAVRMLALTSGLPVALATVATAYFASLHGVSAPYDIGALVDSKALASAPPWVAALFFLGAAARMGVAPLHLWLPVLVGRGRLSIVIPAVISPLSSFLIVRLSIGLFPAAAATMRPALIVLAAASALYGAMLALGQHDARRQLAYLWVSLAGFVLSGLSSLEPSGVSGALLHDVAVTHAITGLLLVARAVEARTGTIDMRRLGSLVRRAPSMATGYFLLGLGAVGFPGTAGFVSEDLLVQGLLHDHAIATMCLLVATALNGVTLVRSFKRIFLGPASRAAPDLSHVRDLLPRERTVFVAIVVSLLIGGFVPTPLLAIREGVVSGAGVVR